MPFILGLLTLAAMYLTMRLFAQSSPRMLAIGLRRTGGAVLVSLAGFLALRGAFFVAIPLFMLGASLMGFGQFPFGFPFSGGSPFGGAGRTTGGASRVRTAMLEMELDHDTGAMDGVVLRGRFEGKRLSDLTDASLELLLKEAEANDPPSIRLLNAFLERRPGWEGQHERRDEQAGNDQNRHSRRDSGMNRAEAFEILGLEAGAGKDEIRRAHRTLMKKLHPDQGGSTYFAARLNEAKDVLLRG